MFQIKNSLCLGVFLIAITIQLATAQTNTKADDKFISYVVDLKSDELKFYWKNDKKEIFRSIENLKNWLKKRNKTLKFATNSGMNKNDNSPQGLYIENQETIVPLDTSNGNGNFYLQPNGVFYITTNNEANISTTKNFKNSTTIKYATQSGPMLLINGQIHSAFKEGTANLNIRNGVGILPNNKIIFAMSKEEINFYDFSNYFKSLGCKNALYLDGFVSQTYLPEKNWTQNDGNFGVIIGITTSKK